MNVLNMKPNESLDLLLKLAADEGIGGLDAIRRVAESTVKYLKGSSEERGAVRELQLLENRWYDSLKIGRPDWSVYGDDLYLAELWACWIVYSRRYLLEISKSRSIPPSGIVGVVGESSKIVDLGCGFGYTTAALAEMFPRAEVIGTNLPGTVQYDIAHRLGAGCRFSLCRLEDAGPFADLVFASEYFEHFERPIDHLQEVLKHLNPRVMLIANSFGAIGLGHFHEYEVRGCLVPGKIASAEFSAEMKKNGYEKIKTNLWNNRPSLWVKSAKKTGFGF